MRFGADPECVLQPDEKWAPKKPELLPQVHEEHNGVNVGFAGLLKLGYDAVQGVAALGGAKLPLNLSALAGFQPFKLLVRFGDGRISVRLSKLRAVEVNAAILAKLQVLPRTEERVGQNVLWVLPVGLSVGFH